MNSIWEDCHQMSSGDAEKHDDTLEKERVESIFDSLSATMCEWRTTVGDNW